ncbi:hypothetical protein [Agromyces sp. Marseille-P2726]|uniref:hypothetical protein n=1 Tax=Agromyces sp. Marseille-P2726 TaxID=2709132 RepID=UPI00156F373B|nr:hypothetical protein [Agromyces sp. Marseille-P2726]
MQGVHEGLRATRGVATVTGIAAAIALVLGLGAAPAMGAGPDTGFVQPYAGTPEYEKWAPKQAPSTPLINRPLGQAQADQIARKLGLDKSRVFTEEQYLLFISGGGIGGEPEWAKLVDESVRIFTNTNGRPLISNVDGTPTPTVLASYGLFVNPDGILMSLANDAAPTKQVNPVLVPVVGYLARWCRHNGCEDSLKMLYEDSAYPSELVFGNEAQQLGAPVQLVPNDKRGRQTTVGMSMAPSIWIVNFVLLYVLRPEVAARMPAWWTPIPDDVVQALEASGGQVPYGDFASSFRR